MDIYEQLRRDEGERLKMYADSRGIPTIGIGHNLRDKAISQRASQTIFEDDLADVDRELSAALPWVTNLDDARRGVLRNMAFNLGVAGLLAFRQTLALIQAGKYEDAAKEMLKSAWAEEVGPRAQRLSLQMKTGWWV